MADKASWVTLRRDRGASPTLMGSMRRSLLLLFVFSTSVACSESRPPAKNAQRDAVPANSLSDARLHPSSNEQVDAPPQADPTQPYTTKVGDAQPPASAEPVGNAPKPLSKSEAKTTRDGKGVSQSECERMMDRYVDLEIGTNPQLKGVPREVIEQAKQTARAQHGDIPCTATASQYACAMAAKTSDAWKRCLE